MKLCKLPTVVFSVVIVLTTACGVTTGGNVANKSSQSSANWTLTENDLANAIYWIDELGVFQLDNGEFNRQYGEGMTQRHQASLERIAFGDLNQDGLSDAAVILAWQSGGSGTFKYLVAMLNTGTAPRQQDGVLLGDRIQIKAMSIAAGQVNIKAVTAGPGDPVCCPAQQGKQSYVLRDGKWVQLADKTADSDASTVSNANITGIVWKWARFEDASKLHSVIIDDPNKYTLILLPNASYQAKADCNRMQGQYTLEGSSIKIAAGAATLAECAPGSRFADYLRHLTEATGFVLHDNKLQLNLMTAGGCLVFENGGAVSESRRH